MNCEDCKSNIPYIVYESELVRAEKRFTKLWVLIILLILMLVGTNTGWLIYESQFENKSITYEATTDIGGTAVVNGGEGDVTINGNSENDN